MASAAAGASDHRIGGHSRAWPHSFANSQTTGPGLQLDECYEYLGRRRGCGYVRTFGRLVGATTQELTGGAGGRSPRARGHGGEACGATDGRAEGLP
jgi:hypothetical protein